MTRNSWHSLLLILSYAALAVAWGWRLHASDEVPVEDTAVLDTTRSGIAAYLSHAPKHLQQAALFQLAELSNDELRSLKAWRNATPEQRVRQLTVQQGPVPAPCPLNTALLFVELTRSDAPLIDDSRLFVSASGDHLEESHKIAALELLATQAIQENELSLAVAIHERACESPATQWANVLSFTTTARLARRPAAALRVINTWLDDSESRLDDKQREEALDLQTTLLLEGTRYAEASRLVLDELRSLEPQEVISNRLMQRAVLATQAAGETAELLPWIERMLQISPVHRHTTADLALGKTIDKDYQRWLREGACIADRCNQTSIACEWFFRLAALGETNVLARLHALATQMGRQAELAELFRALSIRFSTVQLAEAFMDGDAPAAARSFLAAHLKTATHDREGWRLFTKIDSKLRGESSAAICWEAFLKRFPDDVPALQQFAELQTSALQYSQALRTLQQIPQTKLDEASLRRIAALAIHLNDIPAAHRAQQLLTANARHPKVHDVLALAASTLQHPDSVAAQAALTQAMAKLPAETPFYQALTSPPQTVEAKHFSTAVEAK